ncbi:MAG TPA: magnesium transporter [Candidatus Hydrogenedentes bacterium]|nr:magnesium transporter [Candidatus Hydrogenedentota bacterium]
MPETDLEEPWKDLDELLQRQDSAGLTALFSRLSPGEVARVLSRLDEDERSVLFSALGPETAADLMEELADAQAADLIEDLPIEHAADIVEEMESDRRADVLGEMHEEDAEAILREMEPEEAADARHLLTYPEDTAGGIMTTDFVVYPQDMRVADVVGDIRENSERYSDYGLHYVYVASEHGRLVGVVRMRDLLLARPEKELRQIMIVNPIYVLADTPLEELDDFFERWTFWNVPVTDDDGKVIGVVRRAAVEEALYEEQEKAFLRYSGIITGEELRSMPLRERASRRLVWLVLNMALSITAASVILLFEGTVGRLFALVFFMPVICNMSGCSGNQAVAVSIRELALGLIRPGDYVLVWAKEVAVGLLNGVVLGGLLGVIAYVFWHDTPVLGMVIGAAFALNTLVAVSLGGLIPMVLRRLGMDPALGAPPILTTLTDMCGFLLVLSLATTAVAIGWIG